MTMSEPQGQKTQAAPVTVALTIELRTRLDLEAVRRSVREGRPVTRSAVARDLLERGLADREAA